MRMHSFRSNQVVIALTLAAILSGAAVTAATAAAPALADRHPDGTAEAIVAPTASGSVRGAAKDGVIAFKGIPFAQAPVGALRWRAPLSVAPWQGLRDATEYGADCMQLPFPGDAAPLGVTPSEDCLYLNVWRPAQPSLKKRPVMVWIYGGGFVNGGSSPSVYDGSQFARKDVVLVSFNYRIGRFGFFAHPALSEETPAGPLGNYGFMDQLAALRWVQRNIAAFGGDPGNVTVFGESAGGASVNMLMTSPLAAGLFHKAILQSGGGRNTLLPMRALRESVHGVPSAEAAGVAFAAAMGVADTGAAGLAALRALPGEKIVDGLNMGSMWTTTTYSGPMIDGVILRQDIESAYRQGKFAAVPMVVGATALDGFFFGKTLDDALAPAGEQRDEALATYDPQGKRDVQAIGWALAGDSTMIEPVRFVARQLRARGVPAYAFRFSYVAEAMRKEWPGAYHSTEIPYVFDTVQLRYGSQTTPRDEATAQAMLSYWTGFAHSGQPGGPGQPRWPVYDERKDKLMDFAIGGPVVVKDPWKARLDFNARRADR